MMLCRVCNRELKSPICEFCGEDNTAYMKNADTEIKESIAENEPEIKKSEKKKSPKVRKYKIDYKKLIRLVIIVAVIIIAIVFIKGLIKK